MEVKQTISLVRIHKRLVGYEAKSSTPQAERAVQQIYIYKAVLPDTPPTEIEMILNFKAPGE